MAGSIAKRRISVDPRQIAIDFDAAAAPAPEPAPAFAPPSPAPETRIVLRLSPTLGPCDVVWTGNRRTVLSSVRGAATTTVRMHRIFEAATDELLDAVALYLKTGDRRASWAITQYIDARRADITRAQPPRVLDARGEAHDLGSIFAEVERDHFPGAVGGVGITWGRGATSGARRRRSIRLGTYSHDERVIRVHPHLDQSWVPRFFVRFIVFHEMLHHVEPPRVTAARTEFHTPSFRARERAYPEYARSIAWEKANLGRLLRG